MDKELVSCLIIYDVCEGIDVDSWGAQVGEEWRETASVESSPRPASLPADLPGLRES